MRALRVNYVGELGWELHTPMADMPTVFEALMQAGEPHGIALFGTYAMNSLRMEKAYRAWGEELTNEVTLIAADMERFVAFDKDFVGKAATLRARQDGPPIKLVCLAVESVDNDCHGNEPVYRGDRLVGAHDGRCLWPCGRAVAGVRLCRAGARAGGRAVRGPDDGAALHSARAAAAGVGSGECPGEGVRVRVWSARKAP